MSWLDDLLGDVTGAVQKTGPYEIINHFMTMQALRNFTKPGAGDGRFNSMMPLIPSQVNDLRNPFPFLFNPHTGEQVDIRQMGPYSWNPNSTRY